MEKRRSYRRGEKRTVKVVASTPRETTSSYSISTSESSLPSPVITSSKSSTSSSSSTSKVRRIASSLTRFVRQDDEKEEMITLNDRLARYIDRVSQLGLNDSRAQIQEATFVEAFGGEISEVKEIFERELADARRLHADERERLERECAKYKNELFDLRPRVKSLEKENNEYKRRVSVLESEIPDKDKRIRYLEDELNRLRPDYVNMEKQLKAAKKKLEDWDVMRAHLESRIKELERDLALRDELYNKELKNMSGAWDEKLMELWEQHVENLNVSLFDELQTARQQELDQETRVSELRALVDRIKGFSVGEFSAELRKLKLEIGVKDQNDTLVARIKDLETQLRREREAHLEALSLRDKDLEELRESIAVRIREYNDLLRIKLSLDQEIATYRALLEGGEARLGAKDDMNQSITGSYVSEQRQAVKRRRVDTESQVTRSSTTTGLVSIVECDAEGNYIKLYNPSEKGQSLGGWQLSRRIDGGSALVYKFPNRFKLGVEEEVTVWASDSEEAVHDPPTDVICKGAESWGSGESAETVLENASGEVMARCTELREYADHEYDLEPSGREFRPCEIM